jgi:L-fucose mutarotase
LIRAWASAVESLLGSGLGGRYTSAVLLHSQLIHPEINGILGQAGHHSKVLISDGNYPASSKIGPEAELVSLNLSPGVVTCSQVLRALVTAIPLEAINTMGIPDDDPYAKHGPPPAWTEYEQIIGEANLGLKLEPIQKWDFYDAVMSDDHVLTIQTGDQALWANVLLTIGCRVS